MTLYLYNRHTNYYIIQATNAFTGARSIVGHLKNKNSNMFYRELIFTISLHCWGGGADPKLLLLVLPSVVSYIISSFPNQVNRQTSHFDLPEYKAL